LLADPTVDLGVALLMSMPFYQKRAVAVAEAARASGKPVLIVCTPGAAANAAREEMRAKGFVVYDSFEQALRILCLVTEYDRLRRTAADAPDRPAGLPPPGALASLAAGAQTESEVKKLLATYGVTVAREEIAATPEASAAAAARVGFPVVLKVVSREIVHKSDVGGVRVGLADAAAVKAAADEMAQKIAAAMPGARIEGYSVQEMVRGDAEVIVGIRRDEQFGPIVVVGLGGIAVEILNDVAVATAPVSASRVREMLASLKTAPLFQGARGKPPLDVAAIADAVERMSWLAHDLGPRLVDLEVNPLIVRREGGGAVAVDGRANFMEA
jgi:acetyl-CoA synthetase (ADP-forming)